MQEFFKKYKTTSEHYRDHMLLVNPTNTDARHFLAESPNSLESESPPRQSEHTQDGDSPSGRDSKPQPNQNDKKNTS